VRGRIWKGHEGELADWTVVVGSPAQPVGEELLRKGERFLGDREEVHVFLGSQAGGGYHACLLPRPSILESMRRAGVYVSQAAFDRALRTVGGCTQAPVILGLGWVVYLQRQLDSVASGEDGDS